MLRYVDIFSIFHLPTTSVTVRELICCSVYNYCAACCYDTCDIAYVSHTYFIVWHGMCTEHCVSYHQNEIVSVFEVLFGSACFSYNTQPKHIQLTFLHARIQFRISFAFSPTFYTVWFSTETWIRLKFFRFRNILQFTLLRMFSKRNRIHNFLLCQKKFLLTRNRDKIYIFLFLWVLTDPNSILLNPKTILVNWFV